MGRLRLQVPRVFEPLHQPGYRYLGAHGGRGSGKSHYFAQRLIVRHLSEPGMRSVCVREVQRSLRESVKRLLEDYIHAWQLGEYFRILRSGIESHGGGLILFQGMQNHTAETIKSLEGYQTAWIEEGQAISQRSLSLLRPTIRSPGSEIWASWNPYKPTDPVDRLFRSDAPDNAICVEANYWNNPWFPADLRADMEWDREHDPDKFAHVWCGRYASASNARVFRNWRVREIGEEETRGLTPRYGADWGFSVDPSVLLRLLVDEDNRRIYVTHEAYRVGVRLGDLPQLWDEVPGSRQYPVRADSEAPDKIQLMRDAGFNVVPARKGPGSVAEGVQFLQSYEIVIDPHCVHTIQEFSDYSYRIDPLTEEVLPELQDKDNHVIDSARYALEEVRRGKKGSRTVTVRGGY